MSKGRFIALGISAVLTFDLLAGLLSRSTAVPYESFALGSFLIYFSVGLLGARRFDLKLGFTAAILVGFSEATLGWLISYALGVGQAELVLGWAMILGIIFMVTLWAASFGVAGAMVGQRLGESGQANGR